MQTQRSGSAFGSLLGPGTAEFYFFLYPDFKNSFVKNVSLELTVEWQIILGRAPPILSDPFPVFIHFLSHPNYSAKYAVKGYSKGYTCYTSVYTAV